MFAKLLFALTMMHDADAFSVVPSSSNTTANSVRTDTFVRVRTDTFVLLSGKPHAKCDCAHARSCPCICGVPLLSAPFACVLVRIAWCIALAVALLGCHTRNDQRRSL